MRVEYRWFDGRYTQQGEVEVFYRKTYRGVDIYEGADGWYYVKNGEYYNYFGTIRETQNFIRDTDKSNS